MEHHSSGYVPGAKYEPAQFRYATALRNLTVRRGRVRLLSQALERYARYNIQLLAPAFFLFS